MIVGMIGYRFFGLLVVGPSWELALASRSASPFVQHLSGVASLCLGLTPAVIAILCASKFVTKCPKQSERIGELCCRHPFASAVALVGLSIGVVATFYFLGKAIAPEPNKVFVGITAAWLNYSNTLFSLVLPPLLLVWFAKRRQAMLTADD